MKSPKPHLADATYLLQRGHPITVRCKAKIEVGEIHKRWDSGELPELDSRGICKKCLALPEPTGIHTVYVVSGAMKDSQ